MKILLIAGHGGTPYDSGAVGCGYTEAVETRRMAMAVAPKLKKYGFAVEIYDQSRDAYKVVTQGGSLPLSGVGYVLEFHLNSAANDRRGNGRTTGAEIFVHPSEGSVGAEQAILKRLSALGFVSRGVKRNSSFAVLRHVRRRGVSHALIETCFIDDADDMKLYKNKFYEIADAIADGVAEGFGREVDDMTREEVQKLIENEKQKDIYNTVDECPAWAKPTVQKLLNKGFLRGEDAGLDLSYDLLRVLVINDRAHLYG